MTELALCPDCQKKILGGECLGCRIHQLQAENKRLKEEIIEMLKEFVSGSKGERQQINAELLEKRRKEFGFNKDLREKP